jgi:hypothetical protein
MNAIRDIRTLSCGCCTNGCVCWNHRDEPNGRTVTACAYHAAKAQLEARLQSESAA